MELPPTLISLLLSLLNVLDAALRRCGIHVFRVTRAALLKGAATEVTSEARVSQGQDITPTKG